MITTLAEIKVRKKISDSLFLLTAKLEKYKEWVPGTFMQISLDMKSASNYWLDSRAFSFASWGSPEARILVRKEGFFTTELVSRAEKGFLTSVRYPFGDFLLNSETDKVFLAGGAGISVFLSHFDFIKANGKSNQKILIFYTAKETEEDFSNIYEATVSDNIIIHQFFTDPTSNRYTGRMNTKIILEKIGDIKSKEFYICGPPKFNKYWIEELKEFGIRPILEQWENASEDETK